MPPKNKDNAKIDNVKLSNGRSLIQLDPNDIYFAHSRVRPVFTGCNKLIETSIQEIVDGIITVHDIPYITVIENIDDVQLPLQTNNTISTKPKSRKGTRGKYDDDDEDDGEPFYSQQTQGSKKGNKKGNKHYQQPAPPKPFYVSLNNRRLFMFKKLRAMGVIETIPVQLKPALAREKVKYTRQNCALNARLMGPTKKTDADGVENNLDASESDNQDDENE